jgi:hypothetical protein
MARDHQPLDLTGGQTVATIERFERAFASQAEHGRQGDSALDQRGRCSAGVRY